MTPGGTEFRSSYAARAEYPQNLIHKTVGAWALGAYKSRLDAAEPKLLVENDGGDVAIQFIDKWDSQDLELKLVNSDVKLQSRLGDRGGQVPAPTSGDEFSKQDPQCRFCFINPKGHSRDRLNITRPMLNRLLTYHQVMPDILNFIAVFGQQRGPQNLRLGGFRKQAPGPGKSRIDGLDFGRLGRSGSQYQITFNLRAMTKESLGTSALVVGNSNVSWTPRQAAIHHQFDYQSNRALWMIIEGRAELMPRLLPLMKRFVDAKTNIDVQGFDLTLRSHLVLCEWASEHWSEYLLYVEDRLAEYGLYDLIIMSANGSASQSLFEVGHIEELADEAAMLLRINSQILDELRAFYGSNKDRNGTEIGDIHTLAPNLAKANKLAIDNFVKHVDDIRKHCEVQVTRAKAVSTTALQRKNLMQQYLQGRASDRMEVMTRSAQREAIAMRVVAVLTFFFLPATFVSTVFSTDIIKYQNPDGPNFSLDAMKAWLEATIGLMIMTLAVGGGFWYWSDKRRVRNDKRMDTSLTMLVAGNSV